MRVLVSWVGRTDLNAAAGQDAAGLGPIGQALAARTYDRVVLLCNYSKQEGDAFVRWLRERSPTQIELHLIELTRPTHFGEIYGAVTKTVGELKRLFGDETRLTFHLSPGTPAMAAVWIIVAKTRYGAELIESSRQEGVRTAEIPFAISAEYIPEVYRQADQGLVRLGAGVSEDTPAFSDIVHRGPAMSEVIARARRVAPRNVPVLIEGESGTGKEMLARAIHQAGPRADKPFIAVNCGAIVRDLAESEFFGHRRGAFTGAATARAGYFEDADGGTLFLDEIGELGLDLQVKLLRVLQENQVTRVGETAPRPINVRIVAATNRRLADEVAVGRFRSDLFFRLAVALIRLPPLRERVGDLSLIAGHLLDRINADSASDPGWEAKSLAPTALNRLAHHAWPGNVRELGNTLARAALWSAGTQIGERDIEDALLELPSTVSADHGLLDRPIEEGVDLPDLIQHLARHYLERVLELTRGNKTKAAQLLGLPSHQTLSNWMNKYGVKET